jgi:signal peptidase I
MFKKLSAFFLDVLEVVVFAIAIFLFVYLVVTQPHKIKGSSMEPNFPDGEYLLTDKLSYRFREPKRGEVIVFEAPGTDGDEFIKRIIGLPGETLEIKDNEIYVDGRVLEEVYIAPEILTKPGNFLREESMVIIPEGEYLVLGDNRPFSSDSRAWGLIEKSAITGRAWIVYWPPPSVGLVEAASYDF